MGSPTKILLLGGTREAALLASKLVCEGHDVTTSLAGRTKAPKPVHGVVRVGGFGGVDGLVEYLEANQIDKLIDGTHPFARQISANALAAATKAKTTLEVLRRLPWQKQPQDNWCEVDSLEEMHEHLPPGATVLLALGSQHIQQFASCKNVLFVVRMVDEPNEELSLSRYQLIIGLPEQTVAEERQMLEEQGITHIVCRNSGGSGAYAKIEAARQMPHIKVIIQRMPV